MGALLRNERQTYVMELEVENEEFYSQIINLRAALRQKEDRVRQQQKSSQATVEASYRLAEEVTALQVNKQRLEQELRQTQDQLQRAITVTNPTGTSVSVFDLIEELQAKVRMHKQHVTVLKDELKRLRNYGRPMGDNLEAKDDQNEKNVKRKGLRGSRRKKQNERMKRLSAQPNWKQKLSQAKNSGTSKPIREAKS